MSCSWGRYVGGIISWGRNDRKSFKMEKFHEEQQKTIDLFSDGERFLYFIACKGIVNSALLKQINSLYHR